MSIPMNPYNGGQNLFNFLPGGYYNPTGTGTVPGMKDNPQLQAFVSQMLQLLDGGLSAAEMGFRDNWLRENGYGAMLPPQGGPGQGNTGGQPPRAPAPQLPPGGGYLGGGSHWSTPLPTPAPVKPVPMPILGLPTPGGNMGPNFGGANPGNGGVGTYGPNPMPYAGGNDLMFRGPFPPGVVDQYKRQAMTTPTQPRGASLNTPPRFNPGSSFGQWGGRNGGRSLTGLAQRLLQQTARPTAPRTPVQNPWFRANPTWE